MTHRRWIVIAFAFTAVIINYLDRTALSYAIHPIETTFGLSNTDFGLIASAFGIGYMLITVIGGMLVDRFGSRKIWSLFAVLWSLMCALLGLATGFWWLFIVRLFLGVAEGPSFPAFERAITDWLPVSKRARATAFGLAAVPLASVVGAPFIAHLIDGVGWRAMFFILGGAGIIWAILWYIFFRDHPSDSPQLAHENKKREPTPWKTILFNRALLANNIGFIAFGYLVFFSISWLPGFFQQTYQISLNEIGWLLMIPWLSAALLLIAGGFISDWVWRKTNSIRLARSYVIWISQFLAAISFIPILFSPSLFWCVVCVSLGMGFGMMPNSAFYALNADISRDHAATSLGVMLCLGSSASISAPFLTGLLSTLTGNFSAAILLMSGLTLFSAMIIFIYQHPDAALDR